MSKKKYVITIVIVMLLMLLGFSSLVTAAILQDNEDVPRWVVNTFGFSFFPLMVLGLIVLWKNFKELTGFEFNTNYDKLDKKTEKWKFDTINVNLSKGAIISQLEELKYNKRITNDIIFYKKSVQVIDSYLGLIIFNEVVNDDMEKLLHSKLVAAAEIVDNEKKPRANFQVTVFTNIVDQVDNQFLQSIEELNKSAVALTNTLQAFAPIFLYYIYDRQTGKLYYQKSKRIPITQKSIARKHINKLMLGK